MEHLVFTLVTFVLFTALVGIISGKIVKNSDDQKTAKGYFLAGNGLGGFFIAGSMLLTNLSAENLVGLSGQSYAANMSGMAWEATAVIATIIMAFVFLPMYLRKGYTTLPEFMEERYGVGVRRMVSILFLIGYLVIGIPVCLYAGAIAFEQIFDFATVFGISEGMALTILIVLVGIIGALYAVLGGMRAVAVSDTINGILLVLGSVLVVVFGFIAVGKLSGGGFIVGVKFSLGDDCIAVKSGKIYMGKKYRTPSENIHIRQCLMENGHGAVTVGSEMAGGVKNLVVEECRFYDTDRGLRIKTRRGRGKDAVLDQIIFRKIDMDQVMTPFVINCFYFCDPDGKTEFVQSREKMPVDDGTPAILRLDFEDIKAQNCHVAAAYFDGLPEQKIEQIIMKNITVTYAKNPKSGVPAMSSGVEECTKKGIFARNIKELVLENVEIEGQDGELLVTEGIDHFVQ